MKTITIYSLFFLIVILTACQNNQKAKTQDNKATPQSAVDKVSKQLADQEIKPFLEHLPLSDINSIGAIAEKIKNLPSNKMISDDLFLNIKTFMNMAIEEFNNHFIDHYADVQQDLWDGKKTKRLADLKQLLHKNGLELNAAEGNYYAQWIPAYFPKIFKGRISESLEAFLSIQKKQESTGYAIDGYLLISYDEVAQRALAWEQFLQDYPKAYVAGEARQNYNDYLMILLVGIDNSPVQDVSTSKLLPDIKSLYLSIIKEHPDTHTGKSVKTYYEYLEPRQFKIDAEVYEYVKRFKM